MQQQYLWMFSFLSITLHIDNSWLSALLKHWTGQGGPMNWPTHLPYITPVDFLSVGWFDLIIHSEWWGTCGSLLIIQKYLNKYQDELEQTNTYTSNACSVIKTSTVFHLQVKVFDFLFDILILWWCYLSKVRWRVLLGELFPVTFVL